ncbi:hypothetical protein HY572_05835 [Candidatus Micrarchaeota archaeon]|nr:hypothetical protein [Candidatus Micrarchaeota archaeon]
MGIVEARVNGGKHRIVIQLGLHQGESRLDRPGGLVTFSDFEPEIRGEQRIFVEGATVFDGGVWKKPESEKVEAYKRFRDKAALNVNALFEPGAKAAHRPVDAFIVEQRPVLLFPDVYPKPKSRRLHEEQVDRHDSWVNRFSLALKGVGAVALGATGLHGFLDLAVPKEKRMTRRTFLKGLFAGLGALGLGYVAAKTFTWHRANWVDRELAKPGRITGVRDWLRRIHANMKNPLTIVHLRNAILAEKIERAMRREFGEKEGSAGLVIGAAHAGIVEYLEDPELRRHVIAQYENLNELMDEQLSGFVRHVRYDAKKKMYLVSDMDEGFR